MGGIVMFLICAVFLAPPLISICCDRDIPTTLGGNIVSFLIAGISAFVANWFMDRDMKWAFWLVAVAMPIIHLALRTILSDTFRTHFLHLLRLDPPPTKKKWRPGRRRW